MLFLPVPGEGRLQLLQLLTGEVRPLPALPLLLAALVVVCVARLRGLLRRVWGGKNFIMLNVCQCLY